MPNGHGFSFPYGILIVGYPLLTWGIYAGAGRWWGIGFTIVAGLASAAFTWEALSASEFEQVRAGDPSLNRYTWVINWLVFFAIPGWLVTLLGIAKIVKP